MSIRTVVSRLKGLLSHFIDRLHARDDAAILSGRIKPTHLMAVMCAGRRGRAVYLDGLEPKACIRRPD